MREKINCNITEIYIILVEKSEFQNIIYEEFSLGTEHRQQLVAYLMRAPTLPRES